LRDEIERASARLSIARARGKRPRGFGVGLAVGLIVPMLFVLWAFWAFIHFMSSYG
jgi:hypothetical protein